MSATLIDIPFTVTGGLSTANNSGINTLSGYTCALTNFKFFVPNTGTLDLSAISSDIFVWDLGDGTIQKTATATHIYQYPGYYTVTLFVYNSAGLEFQSTLSKQLSVTNFLTDTLRYVTSDVLDILTIPAGVRNSTLPEITLQRQNSWQSFDSASEAGYTINLYASGSLSKKYDKNVLGSTKWGHIDNTWSFYDQVTADNLTVDFIPVTDITSSTEEIYYVNRIVDDSPEIVKVDKSDLLTEPTAVFVGTSGTSIVYYADDTPNLSNSPVFLYAFLDTKTFSDQQQTINGNMVSPGVLKFSEHTGVTIPTRVKYSPAYSIAFSSNGMQKILLSGTKWQNTQIPFFINFADSNGNITKNYPSLSAKGSATSSPPSQDLYVVNLSGCNSTNTQLLSTSFFRETDSQLPSDIKGAFRGYLVPHEHQDNTKITGSVIINDPANFKKDNYFYWFISSDKNKIYKNFDYKTYTTSPTSGSISTTVNLSVTSAPINANLYTDIYPSFAIAPVSDDLNNNRLTAYVTSTKTDILSTFDTSLASYADIDLRSIFVVQNNQIESIPAAFSKTNNITTALPTSITLNRNRDLWVALSGSCILAGISSNGTMTGVYPPDNISYNNTTTLGSGYIRANIDPSGVCNLYEPTLVEASADSSIWVAYTNPISSFVTKVKTSTSTVQGKFELAQGYVTKDIVSDNSNNAWICVADELPTIQSKSVTIIGGVSAAKTGSNIVYKIQTQSISAFEINQIVQIQGLSNNYYNGKFLIKNVSAPAREITVSPYDGRLNQITTSQSLVSNVTATRFQSDKVYKINQLGTKVYEISGFLSPEFIIVDKNQTPWVLHDVNTLTQISSTGVIARNIPIQTESFISQFVSAGAVLSPTVSTNTIHFGGLGCNTQDNIIVLDSYENKLFTIPLLTPVLSGYYTLNTTQSPLWPNTVYLFGNYKAKGDWTGFRWLNKYFNTTGDRALTGETTLNVYPLSGKYRIAKINENFDPSDTIKSYRGQPQLFEYDKFFDDFIGTIVGVASSEPTVMGKRIYEKIANFLDNHADIDTCNLNAFYSICQELDVNINNYNFTYPGNLQRVIDLLSISRNKLIGFRNKFSRDFDRRGFTNSSYGINLGAKVDTRTHILTAGKFIVARQFFTGLFNQIPITYVSGLSTAPGYSSKYGMLSSYPLSGFSNSWGWGLEPGITGIDIEKYYEFFTYIPTFNNIQLEGVIDWNNSYNTVTESMSSSNDWIKDNGIIDTMIDYELRRGLGLFVSPITAINTQII